ncbi:TRZ/ATZ family hydrolase [Chitinimonas lacunae]|uniref:5-methylthioadenosine/S-adenosylhomocysteine deaminase n=1 Tax=Chitinimonas lacunae TaxID=1963018 RepID=A0ABV8MIM3_9NEIS
MSVSFCLHPRWLVPVAPAGVLEQHALVVENGRIAAVLPSADARLRYAHLSHRDLPEHVLLPGLVNLHGHSAMTLLRGLADDLALMDWLNHHIWPAEKRHVSDEFVYDGSLLAMAEMLRCGTTTINDMYFHHEAVARAGLTAQMRTVVGCSILEFPTPYAADADAYIERALAAHARFQGEQLVRFTLAPHAPYTVSDATFRRVVQLAGQLDCAIHCHIHETREEVEGSLREHGVRPLARLASLGLLDMPLIAAHCVHLDDAEIALLARHRVGVAHNPSSNLKLASGLARIHDLRQAGVAVGIGTDGAASNNKLDMLAETRLAALLPKVQAADPRAIPATEALRMATLGGAEALGMAAEIGSLEVGKRADLLAVDLSDLATQPCYDPISHLVYAAGREQVSDVWVDGRQVLEQGRHTTLDPQQLKAKAGWWRDRVLADRHTGA